jgi:hypothetical protein
MAFALGITESRLADAYNIANITPNILYELALGGILTSVVVPVVVEWLQQHGRDAAWDVVRRLFKLALLVLTAIAVLGIVSRRIAHLHTSGSRVPEDTAALAPSSAGSCRRSSSRWRRRDGPPERLAVRRCSPDREQRRVIALSPRCRTGGPAWRVSPPMPNGSSGDRPRWGHRDDRGAVALGPGHRF